MIDTGTTTGRTAGVIAHPPLIYAAALGGGLVLDWLVPIGVLENLGDGRRAAGLALFLAALALVAWCSWLFHRAGTNVPTNRPVEALVTSGPYRWSRNPIYVALSAAYLGVALIAASVWALVFLPAVLVVMTCGVIMREEVLLEHLFGEEFRAYSARVRRWL